MDAAAAAAAAAATAAAGVATGEGAYYLHHPPYDPHLPVYNYTYYYPPRPGAPTPPASAPYFQPPATNYPPPLAVPPSYVEPEGVRRGDHVYSAQPVQYYQDPAAQDGQFLADHATGVVAISTEQPTCVNTYWNSSAARPQAKISFKRKIKKTKVVQSAWCGVCNVECTSKEVLHQHKLGKRHMKNVEKLHQPMNSQTVAGPGAITSAQPTEGLETSTSGTKKRKVPSAPKSEANLETKKQKIMESGAAPEAVRMCTICNVVCNSDVVFSYHLAGQKHASQLKKHLEAAVAVGGAATVVA